MLNPRIRLVLLLAGFVLAFPGHARAETPPVYPNKSDLLFYKDAGKEVPVKTPADWAKRRADILANMQLVMGAMPDASRKVPLDPQTVEEVKTDKYIRRKITIAVEKGDRLSFYLLIPLTPCPSPPEGRGEKEGDPSRSGGERSKKRAAVLCLHPTSRELGKGIAVGLGPKEDRAYAVHLAEMGYVTLAPDYINSGEYKFDPYTNGYESATMKGIWNHMRCVDFLQSLPEVDPARIGVIGHSLGGHNSIFVAVFDPRIKCVVSNCGFCSFRTYMKGDLTGWGHDGYMPKIRSVYDRDPKKMPFEFTEVIAALAPSPFLASAPVKDTNFDVDGVKECVAAAKPVYELLGAAEKLAGSYPDCGHDFPPEARKPAYDWLDRWLRK